MPKRYSRLSPERYLSKHKWIFFVNLFILDLTEIDGTAQVKAFRLLLPCYDLNNVGLLVFVF